MRCHALITFSFESLFVMDSTMARFPSFHRFKYIRIYFLSYSESWVGIDLGLRVHWMFQNKAPFGFKSPLDKTWRLVIIHTPGPMYLIRLSKKVDKYTWRWSDITICPLCMAKTVQGEQINVSVYFYAISGLVIWLRML